jgi:glycosyltransferase involved in cell wall biosynthesis
MKVLVVTVPLPRDDGASAARMAPLARQVSSLRQLGIDVDVLEVKGPAKLKYALTVPQLWSRSGKVDLIHAHYGFCGWLGRLQLTAPLVISLMGSDLLGHTGSGGRTPLRSRVESWSTRRLVRLASAVIVKSQEMAEHVDCSMVSVIPNGVDVDLFRPMPREAACAALGWSRQARHVLFPGNPGEPRKGYPLAEETLAEVRAQLGHEVALVPLWGIPPSCVPTYMNAADAMIMTSFAEGSPNVIKEAMACNLPVVSVPVGDVEWLLSGVQGSSVCPRDRAELANALLPVLGSRLRSNGRAALLRLGLDTHSVARQVQRIYNEVLHRN